MINLFLRVYVAILLSFVGAWIATDWALEEYFADFLEWENRIVAGTSAAALHREMAIADFEQRRKALQEASKNHLYHADLELISEIEFTPEELAELAAGNPVFYTEMGYFRDTLEMFVPDLDPDHVVYLRLGDHYMEPYVTHQATLFGAVFLICAVMLLLIIAPIVWHLRALTQTVQSFGLGQLGARATVGGPKAVAELGTAFNTMANQLQQARLHQEVMTHAVSHEVRTPLARLRLSLDMVEDCPMSEEVAAFVANMQADVDDLEHLSDALLSWAKTAAAQQNLDTAPLTLPEDCADTINNLAMLEPQIPILVKAAPSFQARGNATLLNRALDNLIRNAQKYGARRIQVTFDQSDGRVFMLVDDDGPGIPEPERERLFAPFACLDESRSRSSGGFGLGMAIVERVFAAHQGKARIEDSPLGGTRIACDWPKELS
ncbi:ATP-binding protein [Acanthopleuribacter pedis]|uniref:histidine kinase n=1 Tax=Acanthopleuribacter pedis TaxID=442870 RepID=A0A8J7QI96_9BACT|nr:ATP-binding protein [Acanthopleuribacter pedis]MBO1320825.1 hypothetical protein [Acanthopleuribacter pedis]